MRTFPFSQKLFFHYTTKKTILQRPKTKRCRLKVCKEKNEINSRNPKTLERAVYIIVPVGCLTISIETKTNR